MCISYSTVNGTKSNSCINVISSRTSFTTVVLSGRTNFIFTPTFVAFNRNEARTSFLFSVTALEIEKGPRKNA